jgi:threonine 3-dehydrogenase
MLALTKAKPEFNGLALQQKEVRQPGPGEMLLKLNAAGVCGSDVSIYKWAPWYANRVKLPRVIGHEMSGTVQAIGAGVVNVKVGDHVSLESHIFCGNCYQCQIGRAHVCPNTKYPGTDVDGVMSEYVTLPSLIAWVNPPGTSFEVAAVLEPFGIAVHATLEGSGVSGQSVVINGCGPIGLMNIAVARQFGASTIIAVDPNPLRRTVALQMGADIAVDPGEVDLVKTVKDMTRGRGADVVFEWSGAPEGVKNAFSVVTPLGDVRWCATPSHPFEFDFNMWKSKRATIYNIHGRRIWETWAKATPMIYEKRIDLKPVLSHVIPLSEAPRAFQLILDGQAVKPVLVPD